MRVHQESRDVETGLVGGRLWWEQTDTYWELPFYTETGITEGQAILSDRDDWLAAREQLWAIREGLLEDDVTAA